MPPSRTYDVSAAQTTFVWKDVRIRIGKNAAANKQLILDADPNDLWIHVANLSGAHGIIEAIGVNCVSVANLVNNRAEPMSEIIRHCCEIMRSSCAKLTATNAKSTSFHVTRVGNLKHCKAIGQVAFITSAEPFVASVVIRSDV